MFTKDNFNILRQEKQITKKQKYKKVQKQYNAKKENKNKEKTQVELKCVTTNYKELILT